jgi:hypothetical protein
MPINSFIGQSCQDCKASFTFVTPAINNPSICINCYTTRCNEFLRKTEQAAYNCKACNSSFATNPPSVNNIELCEICAKDQFLNQKFSPTLEPIHKFSISQEANKIINGPRRDDYGPIEESSKQYSDFLTGLLKHKLKDGCAITPADSMLIMAGLKILREDNKAKRDNRVDALGYLMLAAKVGK